jgi:hypothetical protein
MTVARDEADEWSGEAGDPLRLAIGRLILTLFEIVPEDSPARARAVAEAIAVEARIRAALHRHQLN